MDERSNKVVTVSAAILAVLGLGAILRLGRPVLFPFCLALFLYFIITPALNAMERLKVSRTLSLILIIVVSVVVLYLMGVLFYTSGKSFAADIPSYGQKVGDLLERLKGGLNLPEGKWDPLAWLDSLDIGKVGTALLSSLGTFFSFMGNLLLILVFLVFMLAGRNKLQEKIRRFGPAGRSAQTIGILENIDRQVQKYLALKTLISLASGIVTILILVGFGVHYAVAFGFFTFVLNYIPNIGSFISKAVPFLFAILQFGGFWKAFWLLVVLTAVDAVLAMVIEPRFMGQGLGLSPLAILFSLFLWGWLWGLPGMVLAVPIMVVLKIVAANFPALRWLEGLLSK
ncbi:MAG: AI-2E family transporter [Candidatus Aminicenantes bacterium]|nr:AI-2E family transporter [Candidatus Aminicenantes bacterium]